MEEVSREEREGGKSEAGRVARLGERDVTDEVRRKKEKVTG